MTSATAQTNVPGLKNPAVVGEARVTFFGFSAYDARLFTEDAQRYAIGKPVALELTYRRQFSAEQLTKATTTELERLFGTTPDVNSTAQDVSGCFRAVGPGDSFTAVSLGASALQLYLNGVQTCNLTGPQVAQRFLSIWLSDKSRDPKLSRRLRGL